MNSICLNCGESQNPGELGFRKYCSSACRQFAYRSRKKSAGFRLLHGRFLSNEKTQPEKESVGSASNTHTKPWYPAVNTINGR